MAEGGGSNENPFSFKKFVKSKEETKTPKTKRTQGKQNSNASPQNPQNIIFSDEARNSPLFWCSGKTKHLKLRF